MSTGSIKSNSAGYTGDISERHEAEPLVCFKCGSPNSYDNTFCVQCGARLLKPLGTAVNRAQRPLKGVQQSKERTILQQTGALVNDPNADPIISPQALQQSDIHSLSGDVLTQQQNDMPSHSDDMLMQQNDMPFHSDDVLIQQQNDMPSNSDDVLMQQQNDIISHSDDVLIQQQNDIYIHSDSEKMQLQNGISSRLDDVQLNTSVPNIPDQGHQTFSPGIPSPSVAAAPATAPFQERIGFNPQNYSTVEISEDDFIKKNTHYYRQKFMEMRMENKKIGWNWAAWFFNVFWCFYRKMYLVGIIFAGIQLLGLLFEPIEPILNLLTALTLGVLGNYFYMRYTTDTVQRAQNLPELQRYTYLRKKGGTSIGAVVILIVTVFLIAFVIGFMEEFFAYIY